MTEWDDRISKHGVHKELTSLTDILTRAEQFREEEGLTDPQIVEALTRLRTVADRVRSHLGLADPALIPLEPVNTIESSLRTTTAQVNAFITNKNVVHLRNANDRLDGALQGLANVLIVVAPPDFEDLRRSVTQFRQSVAQLLRSITNEAEETQENLDKLNKLMESTDQDITQQKGRLDSALNEQTEAFNKSQSERQQAFTKEQSDRTKNLTEALERTSSEQAALRDLWGDTFSKLHTDLEQSSDRTIELLDDRLSRAKKIVGIIENVGTSGEYLREAHADQRAANYWYAGGFLTIVTMVAATFWLVYTVSTAEAEISNQLFLSKIFLSVTLAAVATFILRIAGRRRNASQAKRKIQLELATLEQYLEPLEESERREVIKSLVPRYFFPYEDISEDEGSPSLFTQHLENFQKLRRGERSSS